jgi:hypothetical protein
MSIKIKLIFIISKNIQFILLGVLSGDSSQMVQKLWENFVKTSFSENGTNDYAFTVLVSMSISNKHWINCISKHIKNTCYIQL